MNKTERCANHSEAPAGYNDATTTDDFKQKDRRIEMQGVATIYSPCDYNAIDI